MHLVVTADSDSEQYLIATLLECESLMDVNAYMCKIHMPVAHAMADHGVLSWTIHVLTERNR